MTDQAQEQRSRLAVLHPDPAAMSALFPAEDLLILGCVLDPGWGPIDVAIIHTAIQNWESIVSQLRRRHPALRLVVIAHDLDAASRAVNHFSVDRLLVDVNEIERAVAELRRAPLSDAQRLEREVQTRTAVLQQIKLQWERSFDAVQDPMAVIDADYRLIRVNWAYARHMGLPVVEVPGRICHQLRTCSSHLFERQASGPCVDCPVSRAQQTRAPAETTIEDRRHLRWVVSAYPLEIPDLPGSLVVHYRDVTAQVEQLDKIARADKLSAVGKLAGAVAHELNSPMTSIMVFSEALARKTTEGSELQEHAKEINESAHRCRRLIQGLLRFARRPRSRDRAAVSLASVVEEIRPLLQHRIDMAKVELEVALPSNLAPVLGHVADIEHLLVNLLSNAIEACPPGSHVRLSARFVAEQELVELQVEDDGRGMPSDVLQAAFDPFFSTKSGAQAAGLGLTTCEAMVADMGGTIGLESEPDRGTRAWARLPAYRIS
jgi:two-component system NtrC family sensor kinase